MYIPDSATTTEAVTSTGGGFGDLIGGFLGTVGQVGAAVITADWQKDILRDQYAIANLESQIANAESNAQTGTTGNQPPQMSFFEKYEKWIVGGVGLVAAVGIARAAKLI